MIGLFATRLLSDLERASVHRAAARLDFTGECRRDVWEDEHLIVARVHHAHTPPLPVLTDAADAHVIFDGRPRFPDDAAPGAAERWAAVRAQDGLAALPRLDGAFAAVLREPRRRAMTLVSDRFNSRPLFYREAGELFAFASQASLLLNMPGARRRLDPIAVMQFLAFQSVVDERTFLDDVRALPPASSLECPGGGPPRRYWSWRPPADDGRSVDAHAERLVAPLREATARMVDDGRGLALLLSGGLDARAVVACSPGPLPAITLADFDNKEVGLARAIAASRAFPFTFVRRHRDHHVGLVDLAVALGDGAHRYDNAQFAYLRSVLPSDITALATAYSFDRFLKGNSLPKRRKRLRGWPLHRHDLLPLPDLAPRALAETSLVEHPHSLFGHAPIGEILREPYRGAIEGVLRDTLEGILRQHWDDCPDAITRFEAVSFHMMLGRFPAYLNVFSIRHFFEDRILTTHNALLDAIVATPPRLRLDGLAYRRALRRIAPDIWRITDGNTGMPPGAHPLRLYARERAQSMRQRYGLGGRERPLPDPAFTERSWPNMAEMLRHRPAFAERVAKTIADFDALPPEIFDSAAITRLLEAHLAGRANHVWLLLLLVTFGTWHRRHLMERPGEAEEWRRLGPPPLEVVRGDR
jgi:Asparagine synthase (glutamine-hydrolyzing)